MGSSGTNTGASAATCSTSRHAWASRVAAVRGVTVDGVIRTLLTRGLIEEVGQDEESTATLYGTTPSFLERLGLDSLEDLPALAPYLPEVDVLDEIAEGGRG